MKELVIARVDGVPVGQSPWRDRLLEAGFTPGYRGVVLRGAGAGGRRAWRRAARRWARRRRAGGPGDDAPVATGPVPEGDTLFRTAAGLRPYLVGRVVEAARARLPGPQVHRLIGTTVTGVDTHGKHLLIRFDSGLELRTHLGMNGSWHRYRPGERWRRAPSRAHLVLEVPGAVAVCFEPAAVELFETRVEPVHPVLAALGPDILADEFPLDEAVRRLRDPSRAALTIAEALLDQRALAGIGNVYKNETLFLEHVDPFVRVADVDDATLERLVTTARRLDARQHRRRRPRHARRTAADHAPVTTPPPLGLRPCRPALPPVRDADRGPSPRRLPAPHVLVPLVPAGRVPDRRSLSELRQTELRSAHGA